MTNFEKIWLEYANWLMEKVDDRDVEPLQNITYEICLEKLLDIHANETTSKDDKYFNQMSSEIRKRLTWTK